MLQKVEKTVREILIEDEQSRVNDYRLWLLVSAKQRGEFVRHLTLEELADKHYELQIPSFESVRRYRALLLNGELKALSDKECNKNRRKLQAEYREAMRA